jgi:hypothetical protein
MTYNTCRHAATIPCYIATPRSRLLSGVVDKSYDPTRRGYVIGHVLHGRIDKAGHAKLHLHHHYTTSTFNALDMI